MSAGSANELAMTWWRVMLEVGFSGDFDFVWGDTADLDAKRREKTLPNAAAIFDMACGFEVADGFIDAILVFHSLPVARRTSV